MALSNYFNTVMHSTINTDTIVTPAGYQFYIYKNWILIKDPVNVVGALNNGNLELFKCEIYCDRQYKTECYNRFHYYIKCEDSIISGLVTFEDVPTSDDIDAYFKFLDDNYVNIEKFDRHTYNQGDVYIQDALAKLLATKE